MIAHPFRTMAAVVVLAATSWVGARRVGPAPALGAFLDPVHGVWAVARHAELPRQASGRLPGLGGSVQVLYDRRGVPHIFAKTEADAYRALGYVVARDRLFQLYIQTMAAEGRLTEIAGARALDADREMRRLGLPWAAERKMAALEKSSADSAAREYADGVNAYIDQLGPADWPLEFKLLGVKPPRWQPINSIDLLNRMAWTLAYIAPERDRAAAATRVGSAAAAALFPENTPIQEPIQPNGQRAPRFDFAKLPPPGAPSGADGLVAAFMRDAMPATAARSAQLPADDGRSTFASNNWAVAPKRTAAGHALLAGDPHLDLTLPSIWYEAHLVVPGRLDVYGVTIPGSPGIVIGFDRDVAWTFTNTGADVLDFYAETVDDSVHPTRYRLDAQWRPLERRIETYRGTHGEVVSVDTLYFTHRGPMRREHGRWLSMRWTVYEPSNELAAFRDASHARDVREFESAMAAHFWVPAQNMLVADRNGSIAIRSTGHFPVRPGDGSGLTIRDGALSANDWQSDLPVDRYPQAFDPPQGYLASANQQPIDPRVSKGDYWGGSYDPWRAMRINHLLRADSSVTPDAMRRFQIDPGSERPGVFVPAFLAAARVVARRADAGVDTAKLARAAALLAKWDGRYTLDDRETIIFEAAMTEAARRTWDELLVDPRPGAHLANGPDRVATPSTAVLAELLADTASAWWDDRRTPRVEDRDDILAASLVAALDSAVKRYGPPGSDGWKWGRIRHANIYHLLRLPALSALDLPVPGGSGTLWPSFGSGTHGPSWRMVVELGPTVRAWGTYPGGQSGNPASSRYRDHLSTWLAGALDTLLLPRAPVELAPAATAATLTLEPRN